MLDRRAFMLGALAASFAGLRAYADEPSDAAIQAILQEFVGKDRESTGMVAVVSGGAENIAEVGVGVSNESRKIAFAFDPDVYRFVVGDEFGKQSDHK